MVSGFGQIVPNMDLPITMGPDGEQTGEFSTLFDPGCDPGPVHIHGLTTERLRGAPTFEQVVGQLAAILRGRVMVAHNAQFDYGFLAHEFARAAAAAGGSAVVHLGVEPPARAADPEHAAQHIAAPLVELRYATTLH